MDLSDPPLDLDEPAFMDLFTEFESSQDAETMVCGHLLPATHLTKDQGYTYCDLHVYGRAAAAGILILWMSQVGTPNPEETANTGHLFRADNDAFTLVGLDDSWETIGLQPSPAQRRDRSFLDDDLGCADLDLDASSTGFPWHAGTRSDVPCFCDLGSSALDQPVLDLDSDNGEIAEEEAVLDF